LVQFEDCTNENAGFSSVIQSVSKLYQICFFVQISFSSGHTNPAQGIRGSKWKKSPFAPGLPPFVHNLFTIFCYTLIWKYFLISGME